MSNALQDALIFEGKEATASVQDMMAAMLQNVEDGGGHVRQEHDEYTIRKMLLARDYLQKDVDKMTEMKKAIIADWDRRISQKKEDIANIEGVVDSFVRHDNKEKALSLDVATASLRKVSAKIKVVDEKKVRKHLEETKTLDKYLKEAPLNKTLVQNSYMDEFNEKAEEIAKVEIETEAALNPKKKLTKKREKEILEEVIERELPKFNETLPEGFELEMPRKVLSIRSNL